MQTSLFPQKGEWGAHPYEGDAESYLRSVRRVYKRNERPKWIAKKNLGNIITEKIS